MAQVGVGLRRLQLCSTVRSAFEVCAKGNALPFGYHGLNSLFCNCSRGLCTPRLSADVLEMDIAGCDKDGHVPWMLHRAYWGPGLPQASVPATKVPVCFVPR